MKCTGGEQESVHGIDTVDCGNLICRPIGERTYQASAFQLGMKKKTLPGESGNRK